MKSFRLKWVLLAWIGWAGLLNGVGSLHAATTTNVSVGDNFFNPPTVAIHAGDSVKWNWVGLGLVSHSSTSTAIPALWDSGILPPGSVFTHKFASAGSFPYKCVVHLGQTGTVNVQAVQTNVPPLVAISSPANGAVFAAPWSGQIQAAASDADGSVLRVQFFAGSTLLGTVSNPPPTASFPAPGLAAGTYNLTAVAMDNLGLETTSTAASVAVVTPDPIVLSSAQPLSSSSFEFSDTATPGLNYVGQRSADLSNWLPLATNNAVSSPVTFTDSDATGPFNFYSVKLFPNP